MKNRQEVILAGSGGQGLIMAGILLAETGMNEGKNVVQTQSYGIASRGGFSSSEVIISDDEIIFQHVEDPDVIVVLSQEAMQIYDGFDTTIIYDSDLVTPGKGNNRFGAPFTKAAFELGNPASINIIFLGCLLQLKPVVDPAKFAAVVDKKFKSNRNNEKALQKGVELGNMLKEAMAKC
jgi:2-oxoglutarate ferredoxin oxidoreductase subunit gamma